MRHKLIKLRGKKKQKEVAECLKITTSYYGMIEKGVRNPNLNLAKKIADYYNTTIEEIFFEQSNNTMLDKSEYLDTA